MSEIVKHAPGQDMIPQGTQENGVPFGHEKSDANIRAVMLSVLVVLSTCAVAMLAMAGIFNYLESGAKAAYANVPVMFRESRQLPLGPPLLPSPKDDQLPWVAMDGERNADNKIAENLQLMNPKTGLYQIPDSALSGLAQTGGAAYSTNDRYQWESRTRKFSVDSSGGRSLSAPATMR